jgi:hypothetical protein
MRKHIKISLVVLAAGYSALTFAQSGNVGGSGNLGSGPQGIDLFASTNVGSNPGADDEGPLGFRDALADAFNLEGGGYEFDANGILLGPDHSPYTGRHRGKKYVRGVAE